MLISKLTQGDPKPVLLQKSDEDCFCNEFFFMPGWHGKMKNNIKLMVLIGKIHHTKND